MNFFTMKKIMLGLAVTAMVAGGIPLAAAQGASDTAAAVTTPASGTTAKPTKAERKAARKQARAKKNAELKKLEDAGRTRRRRPGSARARASSESGGRSGKLRACGGWIQAAADPLRLL
jgi:Ni/Co efflux regulator RcnB